MSLQFCRHCGVDVDEDNLGGSVWVRAWMASRWEPICKRCRRQMARDRKASEAALGRLVTVILWMVIILMAAGLCLALLRANWEG